MPKVIKKQPLSSEQEKRRENRIFCVLMTLNILMPLLQIFSFSIFECAVNFNEEGASIPAVVFNNFTFLAIGVLQIISGSMLVRSVFAINSACKELADRPLPTKNLVTHAGSFILYLVAYVGQMVGFILYSIHTDPTNQSFITNLEYWLSDFKLAAAFVSEVLLLVIYKKLASKDQLELQNETFSDVTVEDFDEDAELQLRWWNMLVA